MILIGRGLDLKESGVWRVESGVKGSRSGNGSESGSGQNEMKTAKRTHTKPELICEKFREGERKRTRKSWSDGGGRNPNPILCGFEGADKFVKACERAGGSKRVQAPPGFR